MPTTRRPRVLLTTIRAAGIALAALVLSLLTSPIVLASTEGSGSAGSSPPTLLIAALGGASLAAVWLLRPPGRAGDRRRDRPTRTIAHARKRDDGSDR
jgi:hypothetical protein